jgi:hypothetical protein
MLLTAPVGFGWFMAAALVQERWFVDQPMVLFGVTAFGAAAIGLLNARYLFQRCPQCACVLTWRNGMYPWVLPDICANCNKPLVPRDQLRMESVAGDAQE